MERSSPAERAEILDRIAANADVPTLQKMIKRMTWENAGANRRHKTADVDPDGAP